MVAAECTVLHMEHAHGEFLLLLLVCLLSFDRPIFKYVKCIPLTHNFIPSYIETSDECHLMGTGNHYIQYISSHLATSPLWEREQALCPKMIMWCEADTNYYIHYILWLRDVKQQAYASRDVWAWLCYDSLSFVTHECKAALIQSVW